MNRNLIGNAFLVLVLILGVACGDNAPAPPTDGGPLPSDGGTPAADGGVTPTGSLAVVVMKRTGWAGEPAEGATVALDHPGGGRTELTADKDGKALFTGIDWTAGTAGVTAYLPDYPLRSRLGIREADGPVTVYLVDLNIGDSASFGAAITLSGTATGMADASHRLSVSSAYSLTEGIGPDWSVRVPPSTPCSLVAMEWTGWTASGTTETATIHGWSVYEHPGSAKDETVALDLGQSATPQTAEGSILLPANPQHSLTGALGLVHVYGYREQDGVYAWGPRLGVSTYTANSDGRLSYRVEYLELPGEPPPVTMFAVANDLSFSWVVVHGPPPTGDQELRFLDAPRLLPPDYYPRPLHADIRWEPGDPAVDRGNFLRLLRPDGSVLWEVFTSTGSTSLAVPQPPSTAGTAIFGTDHVALRGYLFNSQGQQGHVMQERWAATKDLRFQWW